MASSASPAAKKKLLELLSALPELEGVQLSYEHPGPAIAQESIYFMGTRGRETAAALGRHRRDETFDLELMVDVAIDGDEGQLCEERCWELIAVVEGLVRENPDMGNTISGYFVYGGTDMKPYWAPGQRLNEATCTLHFVNRK